MVINENSKRKVIPIASGKGGVGKTVIAANLSVDLAAAGKKTLAVDLDLGGSNLHTVLGIKNLNPGLGNFLSDSAVNFDDIVCPTPYENLSLISGDVLVPGLADIPFSQKKRVLNSILSLDVDYIILDLGSGSNFHVLDYFLISNSGMLVVRNQKTSIVNMYAFVKNLVFRFLQRAFVSHREITKYLKNVLHTHKTNAVPPVGEIIEKMKHIDRALGQKAHVYIDALHPKIIVNKSSIPEDIDMIAKVRDLIKKDLEIDIECMGVIFNDAAVDESLAASVPLALFRPDSVAAVQIARISQKILQSEKYPEMPLELDYYADSYELASIEAMNDYEAVQTEDTREEGVDAGEMLAIISTQQKRIKELQGTVRMLTMRNR